MSALSPLEDKPVLGIKKLVLLGCAPIIFLLFGSIFLVEWQSRQSLTTLAKALKKDIAKFRPGQIKTRRVLFGSPTEGNARTAYEAAEYVFGPRQIWQDNPPPRLTNDVILSKLKALNFKPFPAIVDKLFFRLSVDHRNRTTAPPKNPKKVKRWTTISAPLSKAEMLIINQYMPITNYFLTGFQRKAIDWNFEFEKGAEADMINLVAVRNGVLLLSARARKERASEGIKRALQVVNLGEDFAQHPTVIGVMGGVAFSNFGCRILQEQLERNLSRPDYERVIKILGEVKPFDMKRALVSERLMMEASYMRASGLSFDPKENLDVNDAFTSREGIESWFPAFKISGDWTAYREASMRLTAVFSLAPAQQNARFNTVYTELEKGPLKRGLAAIPSIPDLTKQGAIQRAQIALVRILAAAHLHRLSTGGFPKALNDLKKFFPGQILPMDGTQQPPVPFRLSRVKSQVTVSSSIVTTLIYKTWFPR
jgi:hypothetical protein